MDKVKSWAAPLIIFIIGELLFLILFLLSPEIENSTAIVANATANVTSTFWGWSWLMTPGVSRTIVFTAYQIGLFIAVGIAFFKSKI
jgi:capsular polysaccharide biosynthesis protein